MATGLEALMGRLGSRRGAVLAIVGVAAVGVIAVLVANNPFSGGHPARLLRPDDAQQVALGQKVYTAQCAACHGQRLEGQANWRQRGTDGRLPAPPHDASGHTWHHPDDLLFRITKYGVAKAADLKDYDSAMPAFEGQLSDEEIVAVLSWIKSQWPREIRARIDGMNAEVRPCAPPAPVACTDLSNEAPYLLMRRTRERQGVRPDAALR